jgi:hypothetical protein
VIVAEVVVTMLDRDPASVRSAAPEWQPRAPLIDLFLESAPTPGA